MQWKYCWLAVYTHNYEGVSCTFLIFLPYVFYQTCLGLTDSLLFTWNLQVRRICQVPKSREMNTKHKNRLNKTTAPLEMAEFSVTTFFTDRILRWASLSCFPERSNCINEMKIKTLKTGKICRNTCTLARSSICCVRMSRVYRDI